MARSEKNPEGTGSKTLLQLLIVIFAAALCGVAGFYWMRESRLRDQLDQQRTDLENRSQALTNVESNVRIYQQQVDRLEGLRREYVAALSTNQSQVAALRKDMEVTRQQVERVESQSKIYKDAVEQANATIRKQNDQIRFQNDELKRFASERNEAIQRYNRLATNFNDLARKWNAQQEELMRASTNNLAR